MDEIQYRMEEPGQLYFLLFFGCPLMIYTNEREKWKL